MIVLGLTGSIGMGKTKAARAFRGLGVPVFDADAAVHALLAPGGAVVDQVAEAFDAAAGAGGIDRMALGRRVFGDAAALEKLEGILHPMVRAREKRFLAAARRRRVPLVVLDIPLLFETGGEGRCDAVAVVSAPLFVQRARVLGRPGMTPDKLSAILDRQMPDAEKRRRADFVIPTGAHRGDSLRRIRDIVRMLSARPDARRCRGPRPGS